MVLPTWPPVRFAMFRTYKFELCLCVCVYHNHIFHPERYDAAVKLREVICEMHCLRVNKSMGCLSKNIKFINTSHML